MADGVKKNSRLKLLAYKLLTQGIILLGLARDRVMKGQWEQVVESRTFDIYDREYEVCCDCGGVHLTKYSGDGPAIGWKIVGHKWPVRPMGYDYTWRKGNPLPDLAVTPQEEA